MRFCPLVQAAQTIPCTSLRSWSLRSSAASPKHAISSDGHIPTGSASLILVAVDDSVTRQMVVNYLEAHQMRALGAPGRDAMMSHLAQSEPDLAILDLRLGQDNGLDLLRDIRSRADVPVIILADERRDDIDRVVGLGSVPMTVSPRHSAFASFWRACGPYCDGMPGALHRHGIRRAAVAGSAAGSSIGAVGASPTPMVPPSR
jgi:CheY-like chemotaxis protein